MDKQDTSCELPDEHERFLTLFMADQFKVLSYIRSLVHDHAAANDLFQETSLTLWRRFAEFQSDADFAPWAIGIARNLVLRHWRTKGRDRHVFSDAFLETLAGEAAELTTVMDERLRALESCIGALSLRQRDLIAKFYGEKKNASEIARQWNRSVHAVYKSLKTMRRFLLDCVEQRLAQEGPQ